MYGEFILLEKEDGDAVKVERLASGATAGQDRAWLRVTPFSTTPKFYRWEISDVLPFVH